GATSFFVETLQDSQKRDENVAKLSGDFTILSEEWAVEGAKKELEARQMVETLLGQPSDSATDFSNPSGFSSTPPSSPSANVSNQMYRDLKDLTRQLSDIRSELEQSKPQE
ncbi:MAG: hypothetical protein WBA57_02540, partial [Elainellaceae cyanobacterium]